MGWDKNKRPFRAHRFQSDSSGFTDASTVGGFRTATGAGPGFKDRGAGYEHVVNTASTGTSLVARGVHLVASATGAKTYTLLSPATGKEVKILCINATSSRQTTVLISGATGATGVHFLSSDSSVATQRKITMQDANDGVSLLGINSSQFYVLNTVGSPSLGTS